MEFFLLLHNVPHQSLSVFTLRLLPGCRCRSKYLEFLRSKAITSDFQRIKLQEYIDPDAEIELSRATDENGGTLVTPNVPRTFEAELKGDLVDCCVSGDLVIMIGIVKAVQQV